MKDDCRRVVQSAYRGIDRALTASVRSLAAACLLVLGLAPAAELEPVVLQLSYYHQFQFAGCDAADVQGFYAREGLAVEMRELAPGPNGNRWPDDATFVVAATPL